MTEGERHPSLFALDRLRLGDADADADAELRKHLAGCARCRSYVEPEPAAGQQPLPAWLEGVRLPPAPAPGSSPAAALRRRLKAWLFIPSLAAVGAAALLFLVLRPRMQLEHDPFAAIREKGPPALVVYVKRDRQVLTWDGNFSLRAGDALRLQIAASPYGYVSVASVGADAGAPEVLYDGTLERKQATLLPVSFRVDGRGGREVLSLVLARRRIDPATHARSGAPDDEQQSWRQILVFDKETDEPQAVQPGRRPSTP
jgi:hypothetical protein